MTKMHGLYRNRAQKSRWQLSSVTALWDSRHHQLPWQGETIGTKGGSQSPTWPIRQHSQSFCTSVSFHLFKTICLLSVYKSYLYSRLHKVLDGSTLSQTIPSQHLCTQWALNKYGNWIMKHRRSFLDVEVLEWSICGYRVLLRESLVPASWVRTYAFISPFLWLDSLLLQC